MIYFDEITGDANDRHTGLLFEQHVVNQERGPLSKKCLQDMVNAYDAVAGKMTSVMAFQCRLWLPKDKEERQQEIIKEMYYRLRKQVVTQTDGKKLGPRDTCLVGAKMQSKTKPKSDRVCFSVTLLINPRLVITPSGNWKEDTKKGLKKLQAMIAYSWSFAIGLTKSDYDAVMFFKQNVLFLNQGQQNYQYVKSELIARLSIYALQPQRSFEQNQALYFCLDGVWADAQKKRAA